MSKLRNKLASIENKANKLSGVSKKKIKKQAEVMDFTFTGYRIENEEGILMHLETNDESLKQKIKDNTLSEGERNFLISSAGEYYEQCVKKDEKLFDMTIGRPIIDHYLGGPYADLIPDDLINEEALPMASQKNNKTKQVSFNKNKFRKLPIEDRIKFVTEPMLVFTEVWADSFYDKNTDIKNLITIPGLENEASVEARKEKPTCEMTKTRKFRRRCVVR